MTSSNRYDKRGVSADKHEVHAAIEKLDKGLYPLAFCKILPDVAGGDDSFCNIMHADTAGTKTSLAYLYWKETGDLNVWKGIVQDAIAMNVDDMACVGAINNILLSSTIGRNKKKIPGEVLKTLIEGTSEFVENMLEHGVGIHLTGGETADVGDIVRTVDVGFTTFTRMKKSELIINDIAPGQVIVGFSSSGQATYESAYNGGMGSNGLTSARHDLFSKKYATTYPESFDPDLDEEVRYVGPFSLTDTVKIQDEMLHVGKLVLSPTRTYLPLLNRILEQYRSAIRGMIHCTGGAQTKVLKYMKNAHVIKDNLLEVPPLFQLIKEHTPTSYREMYQVFNMGHRLEIYTEPHYAQALIEIASSFNIEAKIIGRVEASEDKIVTVTDPNGKLIEYKS